MSIFKLHSIDLNTFSTITTFSHIPRVQALFHSLKKQDDDVQFQVLLLDGDPAEIPTDKQVNWFTLADLFSSDIGQKLIKKYKNKTDQLRWSLKPVFISYLLQKTWHKVIYVDNDIYFYNDFQFLFDELDRKVILLTPHWRIASGKDHPLWFETNYRDGIYNAGFIGASKGAEHALNWWAEACLYRCEKSYREGMFDDQKYLDLMPVIEPKTGIISHRGCNVAYWNIGENRRELVNGTVQINAKYPVIFIHFADCTIAAINRNEDPLLEPHLKEYVNVLKDLNFQLNLEKMNKVQDFWVKYRQLKWLILGGWVRKLGV